LNLALPPQADGTGHSLVLLDSAMAAQGSGTGEYAGNWRSSTYLRGSPGRADASAPSTLLLNEIVAHTDFTAEFDSNDWIELYNATPAPITLGPGWYLSDDGSTIASLKKWAVPAGTMVPAQGFVSFDEVTGFHNPTNTGFGLNKGGEQVYLSYLPGTMEDRVVDAVSFKGQENDWSLGRYPDGAPFWYALTPRTRDGANAAPPARVIVSEVMFHPPDVLMDTNFTDNSLDEFVELHNATPSPVVLHNTNGTWRLNGGVDFVFPTNITLNADGYLLVVKFDPVTNPTQLAAFKDLYAITDPQLVILGPYAGKLANSSDRFALERPQHPDGPGDSVSWVIVDEVLYSDQSPWPCGGDGTGDSLQRVDTVRHGSDPVNWSSEPPTAGRPRANLPAGLPSITAQPQNRIVATNGNASFSVSLCGTPPFGYQWQFNGGPVSAATNATLNLFNVTLASAGSYRVVVSNAAGSVTSAPAMLIVQFPPVITAQPAPTTTLRDQEAFFGVEVGGTPPFSYQWRFNGMSIAGATNSVLALFNVQTNQAGEYSVAIANTAGTVVSSNATLTLVIPATIVQPPANLDVRVTVNVAASSFDSIVYNPVNVTNSVTAIGTGTLHYQWRMNGISLPGAINSDLVISNVTPANHGLYTVVVTDDIGPAISPEVMLNVLVPPVVFQHPVSAEVVAGANLTLSAAIFGHPPPFTYEWRKSALPVSTNISSQFVDFFILTNVQAFTAGLYRVAIRNAATVGLGVGSSQAQVTLATDTDGDGLPDSWESLFGPDATSLDAGADPDGDGVVTADEHIAGTNPTNGMSYLHVESISSTLSTDLRVQIEFNAASHRTYTVLSSGTASGGIWSRVGDVVAATTNRTVRVFDTRPADAPPRFYRLVTPKNP
jgi:hypothetical protein